MEVHHHPHTERKKWTHYFWEFFMLFLAVTAGYFVEKQREHYINKKIEKRYIISLVDDLKSDTIQLRQIVRFRTHRIKVLDSLIRLLHSSNLSTHSRSIYFYGRLAAYKLPLNISDQTFENMKNSGAIRLIHSLQVSDSIGSYYRSIQFLIEGIDYFERDIITQYRDAIADVFDGLEFQNMFVTGNPFPVLPDHNVVLLTTDPRYLNRISVFANHLFATNNTSLRTTSILFEQAKGLIIFLKKEYHLK